MRAHNLGYHEKINGVRLCKALFFIQTLYDAEVLE
jgi:hypothetical protein